MAKKEKQIDLQEEVLDEQDVTFQEAPIADSESAELAMPSEEVNEPVLDDSAIEEPVQDESEEAQELVQSDEQAADEPLETAENGKKKKRKRKKISDITFENDIRYRGPFSYRWLRIFAWVAIVCAQAAIVLSLGIKLDAKLAKSFTGLTHFLSIIGTLSVPFFLIANFAVIINAKNGYKRLIIAYAFMALVIFALFMLIYQRYILGIINMFVDEENGKTPQENFAVIFKLFSSSGFLTFNIFIDLLLCTLLTYFINYRPTKVFVGKKLVIFRLFVLIPVLYEIASFVIKVLCVTHPDFTLPLYVSPFLTTKPPITFLVFVILSIFVKNRELVFLKRGKTEQQYNEFLKTNTNSLHFSIATSICLIIAAIIDLVLYFVIGASLTIIDMETGEVLRNGMALVSDIGFGHSIPLLLVVPFIILFSYTRTHKPSAIDMIIPNVGMVAFAIVYVEGLYQFILRLPGLISKAFGG